MTKLVIKDLKVGVETDSGMTEILKGVDLTVNSGETHAIMGPMVLVSPPSHIRSQVIPNTRFLAEASLSTVQTF